MVWHLQLGICRRDILTAKHLWRENLSLLSNFIRVCTEQEKRSLRNISCLTRNEHNVVLLSVHEKRKINTYFSNCDTFRVQTFFLSKVNCEIWCSIKEQLQLPTINSLVLLSRENMGQPILMAIWQWK